MARGSKSRRERLIAIATWLRLRFPSSISDDELARLIDAQPATARQLLVLMDFLAPLKRDVPNGMTYGQARRAIMQIVEALNEAAIRDMRIVEGAIRQWKGKYYYVVKVAGSGDRYKVTLRKVELSRPRGASRAVMKPASDLEFKVNPVNMLYVSWPVDLTTWQPDFSFEPRVDPDEPLF